MTDVLTPVLGLVKQTIGGNRNTWGGIINASWDLIEGAVYGMTAKVVTGAADVTLTDSERRKRILSFTGTLTADQNIIVSNLVGRWTVRNGTSGNFALKFKTASGTAVTVPQGGNCNVWCDGNDVMYADLSTRLRDTQFAGPSGSTSAPGLSFSAETDSGLMRVSAKVLALVINTIKRVTYGVNQFKVTLNTASDGSGTEVDVITASGTGLDVGVPFTVRGQAPVPIGASIEFDGITEPNGWLFKAGQAIPRSTYAALMQVLTASANATRNGTTVLSAVDTNLTGLGLEGATIEATGIPSSTTIVSMTSTSITLSQAASGSGTMAIRIFPHGNGDGSTTFRLPDDRGRVTAGRDNMTGPANRLTGQTGGVNGARLGAAGGNETHTLDTTQIPSHNHTLTDPGHSHTVSQRTSSNVLSLGADTVGVTGNIGDVPTTPATTGITIAATGGGLAHNNVQPTRVTNKIIFTGVFS